MRKLHAFTLIFLFLGLSGCEEKQEKNNIPIENCTVIVGSATSENNASVFNASKNKAKVKTQNICLSPSGKDTFSLSDTKGRSYSVKVYQKSIEIKEEKRPITLLTFFATWCPPCVANIPYFNDIEQKYNDKVFISSVLIHDNIEKEALQTFLSKNKMSYFLSISRENNDFAALIAKTLDLPNNFSIPLSILYVRGAYFTHYEGAVPVEMLEYDIKQAIKTLQ